MIFKVDAHGSKNLIVVDEYDTIVGYVWYGINQDTFEPAYSCFDKRTETKINVESMEQGKKYFETVS